MSLFPSRLSTSTPPSPTGASICVTFGSDGVVRASARKDEDFLSNGSASLAYWRASDSHVRRASGSSFEFYPAGLLPSHSIAHDHLPSSVAVPSRLSSQVGWSPFPPRVSGTSTVTLESSQAAISELEALMDTAASRIEHLALELRAARRAAETAELERDELAAKLLALPTPLHREVVRALLPPAAAHVISASAAGMRAAVPSYRRRSSALEQQVVELQLRVERAELALAAAEAEKQAWQEARERSLSAVVAQASAASQAEKMRVLELMSAVRSMEAQAVEDEGAHRMEVYRLRGEVGRAEEERERSESELARVMDIVEEERREKEKRVGEVEREREALRARLLELELERQRQQWVQLHQTEDGEGEEEEDGSWLNLSNGRQSFPHPHPLPLPPMATIVEASGDEEGSGSSSIDCTMPHPSASFLRASESDAISPSPATTSVAVEGRAAFRRATLSYGELTGHHPSPCSSPTSCSSSLVQLAVGEAKEGNTATACGQELVAVTAATAVVVYLPWQRSIGTGLGSSAHSSLAAGSSSSSSISPSQAAHMKAARKLLAAWVSGGRSSDGLLSDACRDSSSGSGSGGIGVRARGSCDTGREGMKRCQGLARSAAAAAGAVHVKRDRDLPRRMSVTSAATCTTRQPARLGSHGGRRSSGVRTMEQDETKPTANAANATNAANVAAFGAGAGAMHGPVVVPPAVPSSRVTAGAERGGERGGQGGRDVEAAWAVESMVRRARMTTAAGRASEGMRRGGWTAVGAGAGAEERRGRGRRSEDGRQGGRRVAFGLVEGDEAQREDDPRDNIENVAPVWV